MNNSLNYLDIVLEGYFKRENRLYLDNYFYRVFKQCEKQYFEMDEFFDGCLGVIDSLNNEFQRQISEHLIDANKAILSFEKSGKEKQAESIAKRIKHIRPNGVGNISFTINMLYLTNGRIAHHMTYDEVEQIKLNIKKAYLKAKEEKLQEYLTTSKGKENSIIEHPFNDETFKIFEYLVKNWKYDKQQKWADIFIELDSNSFTMPYKNYYEGYVRKTYSYTGKFQYDKIKKESNRHRIALQELINNFSKK